MMKLIFHLPCKSPFSQCFIIPSPHTSHLNLNFVTLFLFLKYFRCDEFQIPCTPGTSWNFWLHVPLRQTPLQLHLLCCITPDDLRKTTINLDEADGPYFEAE